MKPIPLATLALLGVLACSGRDARLENLSAGITKDSSIAVMGGTAPQRIDPYLIGGKYIEIMYFAPAGSDSVDDRKASPLIAIDGVLQAWGWNSLDSLAAATKIQVAPK